MAVVTVSVAGATAAAWVLRSIIKEEVPFLPFTLAVVICFAYGGFDMNAVVEMARNDLRARINETGATILAGGLPPVRGRQIELLQLLENLIGNAMKYRSNRAPEIRIAAEAGDGY